MNIKKICYCTLLIVTIVSMTGCGSQASPTPTVTPTAALTATPTPEPYLDPAGPITVDGAKLSIVLATDDTSLYDSGPFAVQHEPDVIILHVEAKIESGEVDLGKLSEQVSLLDDKGNKCPLVSSGTEKPFWEFMAPINSESFLLQFPGDQIVKLDSILKLTSFPAGKSAAPAGSAGQATSTPLPPTAEPVPQVYIIPAGVLPLDTKDSCSTDATINSYDGSGFNVGGTISMHYDQWVLWCPNARHTWTGSITYENYTFDSDAQAPLVFTVDSEGGYDYTEGKGKVTQPDGKVISFPAGAGDQTMVLPTQKVEMPTAVPTQAAAPVTGSPTQALYPPLQSLLEDTLAFIAQKFHIKFELLDVGYVKPDGGSSNSDLRVRVRCVDGGCTSGQLYQWIVMCIEGFEAIPSDVKTFHIQVIDAQDNLLEDATGKWSDMVDYHKNVITPEQFYQKMGVFAASSNSTAPPEQATFTKTHITDSFDGNTNKWPVGDVNVVYWKGSREIKDGVLNWYGVSRENMFSSVYPEVIDSLGYIGDQKASLRVKVMNSPVQGAFGLILRSIGNSSSYAFYSFMVDTQGNFCFMLDSNDNWTPIIDWQQTTAVDAAGWNKLSVEAVGSHFKLFINDELVGEADDDTLKSGTNGLVFETYESSVSFDLQMDDFDVRVPASSSNTDAASPSEPADWQGIPIMPGAFDAGEKLGDYQFYAKSSSAEIKSYYKRELIKLGWELRQDMMDSIPTDLAFKKGDKYVFFKIGYSGSNNLVDIHFGKP
jgi:hypothetical protein